VGNGHLLSNKSGAVVLGRVRKPGCISSLHVL
jgi:hypothetical protein